MQEAKLGTGSLRIIVRLVDLIVLRLGEELKNGFQWTDIVSFMTAIGPSKELQDLIKSAKEIFPEARDLDLPESMELLVIVLMSIPKYIEAFKDPALREELME